MIYATAIKLEAYKSDAATAAERFDGGTGS